MRVEVTEIAPGEVETDLLAAAVFEGELTGRAAELDGLLGGRLSALTSSGELTGKRGAVAVLHVGGGAIRATRVAIAGLGARDDADEDALRTAAAAATRATRAYGGTLSWLVDGSLPFGDADQARLVADGVVLASYRQARWKTVEQEPPLLERLVVVGPAEVAGPAERAAIAAAWTNRARDLVNSPPNETAPTRFAERAEEIAAGAEHLTSAALGPEAMEGLGMGALLAVGRGSRNEPRLVVLRYDPPGAPDDVVLGLVGKGITFDTGGISLKPGLHMEDMKGDMAGGAAVLEAMGAIAELGLPVRAICVVASAENMPGGGAYRPGDILTAANGKTIEIINTDAEGRLVLADALWYARREGATHVVDLATLTGAMVVALGDQFSGFYCNDDDLAGRIARVAEHSGDHAWRLPLHPRYRRYVDSDFADMKNASDLREAGAALAAEFLREFAGDGPWAHVDIAGPAFLNRSRGDYLAQRGGTGYGVRLLVELASTFSA